MTSPQHFIRIVLIVILCLPPLAAYCQSKKPLNTLSTPRSSQHKRKPLIKTGGLSDSYTEHPTGLLNTYNTNDEYDMGRRLRFGFVMALNFSNFNLQPNINTNTGVRPNIYSSTPGFGAYALMTYRFNRVFDFRTQLGPAFGQRTIVFDDSIIMSKESVFVELPLNFKFKAVRRGDIRPYAIAGLTPAIDVLAFKKFIPTKSVFVGLNEFDVRLDIGVGIDIYMPFFKMSTELKYTRGIMNSLFKTGYEGKEQYTNSLKRLDTNMFVFSIYLE